ncbi:MAG: glycosyltransferase [Deferrisomatales bacterium]
MGPTPSGRLRVAQVIWNGVGGGAERALRNLAKGIDRTAFDVRFCVLHSWGEDAEVIAAEGFPTDFLGWRTWYSVRGRVRLASWLRRFAPEVVHVHTAPPFVRCIVPWMSPCRTVVASEHGAVAALSRERQRISLRLFAMDYRGAALVVVHSAWMREMVRDHYGIPPERIRMVTLGVGPEGDCGGGCPSEAWVAAGERYRIGYVGRLLSSHKGCDLLPHLARGLLDAGFVDFEFVVLGDGPDRAAIELACRDRGVAERFSFPGWVENVDAWMPGFDVLVVPSRFEPFGMVVPEALRLGVRVVSFDVGGLREASAGCEEAVFVNPGDVGAMVSALEGLMTEYGRSRSPVARRRACQAFSIELMARETEAVYREAAAEGRRGG